MNFPWLLLILLTPLIATVLLFIPKKYVVFKDNQIALYSSLITLLFVIVVALQFDINSNLDSNIWYFFSFRFNRNFISPSWANCSFNSNCVACYRARSTKEKQRIFDVDSFNSSLRPGSISS